MEKREFDIGDRVICVSSGVVGEVIKFYYPTACAEQTMVQTDDGRKYHAPTAEWKKTDTIPGIFAQDKNRKEGCEPKYLGENTSIGCRNGKCKCGNIVKSYQKYCDECGIKLEWGNVRAQ